MKIGFTGHRDKLADEEALLNIACEFPGATWVHGGARGFDAQAASVARELDIPQEVIRPDYKSYPAKEAPLIRNKQIVNRCVLLVACYDGRFIGGTAQTIRYARDNGIPVRVLTPAQNA